mgnify:CR=1 FL=1
MKKTPGNPRSIPICEGLLSYIIDLTKETSGGKEMCINIYDVRLADTVPACGMNWPPNLHATYDYLHRQDVRTAFHVSDKDKPEAWIECNSRVGSALSATADEAAVTYLPGLLEDGLEILIFAGDQDLICNHIGLERMIENLEWLGKRGFGVSGYTICYPSEATDALFTFSGRPLHCESAVVRQQLSSGNMEERPESYLCLNRGRLAYGWLRSTGAVA